MPSVVFQKTSWVERLESWLPFNPLLLLAGVIGILLGLAFIQGNWIQILVVGMLPFLFYAVMKNTMVVFLLWIGTTPILSNFVRINLGTGIPDITINRVAVMILMLVLFFQVGIKIRGFKRIHPVEWSMFAVVLMLLPAIFRAVEPIQAAQQTFDNIVTPFFVFFLAKNLITDKEEIRPLVWTIGFVTLYCAILGFQEHFTEYSLFTETGKLYWQQEGMADRIQGPFASPQILGSVMVGGVVFFFYQMFNARRMPMRLFSFVILIVHTFVTYWTYRRSVWVGYIATMLFLGFVEKRFRKPLIVLMIITISVMAVNWQLISQTDVYQNRLANSRTVNDRLIVWMTSWEIIKHYPLFGTGLNWFGFYYQKYFTFFGNTVTTDYAHNITSAHNSYIRLWVEGGPFLALPYLIMLVFFVWRLTQLLRGRLIHPTTGKMEVMVFVGVFLTQYLQCLTTDLVFHGKYATILVFLIAGVLFQECERPVQKTRRADVLLRASSTEVPRL